MIKLTNYFSDLNKAVLTTSFVLSKEAQITKVYHHLEDDMWEFISERSVEEANHRLISMEEILNIDESLMALSNMEPGFYAFRKEYNNGFEINNIEE